MMMMMMMMIIIIINIKEIIIIIIIIIIMYFLGKVSFRKSSVRNKIYFLPEVCKTLTSAVSS